MGFKIIEDAESFIDRLREEAEQRKQKRIEKILWTNTTTPKAPEKKTIMSIPSANHTTEPVLCPGVALSGTLKVSSGSRIVTTTVDLRSEIQEGEMIRIKGHNFIVTEPRDKITLTISDEYPEEDDTGV